MLIRAAEEKDARAIASFIVMAESEMVRHFTGTSDPEASVRAIEEFVVAPETNRYSLANNLVAEVDGVAAGSIISFPADRQPDLDGILLDALNRRGYNLERLFFEGEPGTYYLSTMGVNPDFRGKGIGTALLAAAGQKGAELGFSRASLLVSKGKPKVQALYEKLGYSVLVGVAIGDVEYNRMVKPIGNSV